MQDKAHGLDQSVHNDVYEVMNTLLHILLIIHQGHPTNCSAECLFCSESQLTKYSQSAKLPCKKLETSTDYDVTVCVFVRRSTRKMAA